MALVQGSAGFRSKFTRHFGAIRQEQLRHLGGEIGVQRSAGEALGGRVRLDQTQRADAGLEGTSAGDLFQARGFGGRSVAAGRDRG